MSLKYIIKNTSDVTEEMYDASVFNSQNVRKSNDGSKVILKFEGNTGTLLDGETVFENMSDLMETVTEGEW